MAAQKKYPDELREIRRIWGNYVSEDLNTKRGKSPWIGEIHGNKVTRPGSRGRLSSGVFEVLPTAVLRCRP